MIKKFNKYLTVNELEKLYPDCFKVGSEVVCIDTIYHIYPFVNLNITKGKIYKIHKQSRLHERIVIMNDAGILLSVPKENFIPLSRLKEINKQESEIREKTKKLDPFGEEYWSD